MVGNLGGSEVLLLCSIIGGVAGIYFRDKSKSKWIGVVLGVIGGCLTAYLFVQFVYASILAMPIYAIFGSWLFNFIFKKLNAK